MSPLGESPRFVEEVQKVFMWGDIRRGNPKGTPMSTEHAQQPWNAGLTWREEMENHVEWNRLEYLGRAECMADTLQQ